MEKLPFDLSGWDYARPRLPIDSVFGGKGIGLALCGKIATGSKHFFVPPWFGVYEGNARIASDSDARIDAWIAGHKPRGVFLRSSGKDEDWRDGRSGVDRSDWCEPDADAIKRALRERIAARRLPVVVQKQFFGYGCVVDVGWSHILGKVVVRIAMGNKWRDRHGIHFSSATWDNEARVGLYDAETGKPIIAIEDEDLRRFLPGLAGELVDRLRAVGIDYGVQLEMIIHPICAAEWGLVQIRPSPDALRGTVAPPPSDGTLLMTTARVGKAGTCEGETVVLGEHCEDELDQWIEAIGRNRDPPESMDGLPTKLAGKIVLWNWSGKPKHDYNIPYALGAARLGGVGQVSRYPLINSSHGDLFALDAYYGEMARRAKASSLVFGTARCHGVLCDAWQSDWPREPVRLRMASDGLVGRIYQL